MNLTTETTTESTAADAKSRHCWFDADRVPGDSASTAWKRTARLRQADWREARNLPIGTQPHGDPQGTPVGSRIELSFAKESGANFLTPGARRAAEARLEAPEPNQMLDDKRLWADLLSSMPLCFNLFGDLAVDGAAAGRAVQAWWPVAPRGDVKVRLEHSPGRRDPTFLGNRSAFDAAFEIVQPDGRHGIVGVETKYHEHAKAEAKPEGAARARYLEVAERAGIFVDGWHDEVLGKPLQQIWLDHLLVLSMLQHPSGRWTWGRFVLVYPSENPSFAAAADRYRALLRDASTFEARTIEDLIDTPNALEPTVVEAIRTRYLRAG